MSKNEDNQLTAMSVSVGDCMHEPLNQCNMDLMSKQQRRRLITTKQSKTKEENVGRKNKIVRNKLCFSPICLVTSDQRTFFQSDNVPSTST